MLIMIIIIIIIVIVITIILNKAVRLPVRVLDLPPRAEDAHRPDEGPLRLKTQT